MLAEDRKRTAIELEEGSQAVRCVVSSTGLVELSRRSVQLVKDWYRKLDLIVLGLLHTE